MRVRDKSAALPLREGQTQKASNILVGRPTPADSLREVSAEGEHSENHVDPTRVFILKGTGAVCGILLICLGMYGIYAKETALLRDLIWPISMCGGAVVLWASGNDGMRVLRRVSRTTEGKSDSE